MAKKCKIFKTIYIVLSVINVTAFLCLLIHAHCPSGWNAQMFEGDAGEQPSSHFLVMNLKQTKR